MIPTLAMHMSNELLSLPLAVGSLALAACVVGLAARKSRQAIDSQRLPLMGVMGAFVFAAQMINFAIPGLGTSGHLGGAVLLAILLRPASAIITMAGIIIIQCLLFQDGGPAAIGCNIINIGVVPALVGWAVYKAVLGLWHGHLAHALRGRLAPVLGCGCAGETPAGRMGGTPMPPLCGNSPSARRQYLAAWLACMAGVTAGAALVPLEVGLSGVLQAPTAEFLALMVGLHLPIALVEGAITFAVLAYLRRVRPAALGLEAPDTTSRLGRVAPTISIAATAFLLAGIVSWFASEHPDGLESAWAKMTAGNVTAAAPAESPGTSPEPAAAELAAARAEGPSQAGNWAPMPDYNWRAGWLSIAGIVGTAVTLVLGMAVSKTIAKRDQGLGTRDQVVEDPAAP